MTTALVKVPPVTYIREAYVDPWGHKHKAVEVTRKAYERKIKKRKKRKRASKKKQRFSPKVRSGWSKSMPAAKRRKLLLRAHKGDLLAAARSKQALANVTQDEETKVLALADAGHFFKLYREEVK